MTTIAEQFANEAAAFSRQGKHRLAAEAHQDAAFNFCEAKAHQRAVTHALCAVSCHIEAGELPVAEDVLESIEEELPKLAGIEDHTLDSVRTKKLQLKTLRAERTPVAATTDWNGPLKPIDELSYVPSNPKPPGEVAEVVLETPGELLTPQDVLDRAKGVGVVNVTINEAGNVFFTDGYTVAEGEDAQKAGHDACELIREALETVGLTTENAVHAEGKIAGRVIVRGGSALI
ncbi:hypothetical protein [Limnoglobus roseus]|uniref:Uncharacterized protein n=1 Tax=Limnoglobus roseus TaxID=2598579 RepID=A0A5C1AGG7_9BACT|nr:hypothetical protein [Limnoglobus roseus]QEL18301.1 hypothetical protein PX52LOC_05322 [Limnoglobus roseus]